MQNCLLLICDTGAIITISQDEWPYPYAPDQWSLLPRDVKIREPLGKPYRDVNFGKFRSIQERGVHIYVQL